MFFYALNLFVCMCCLSLGPNDISSQGQDGYSGGRGFGRGMGGRMTFGRGFGNSSFICYLSLQVPCFLSLDIHNL